MNIPKIDISALPDLDQLTGVFGSLATPTASYDDFMIALMAFVYEMIV